MYPLTCKFPPLTFLVLLPIWGPEDRMQAETSGTVSSQPYNQKRASTKGPQPLGRGQGEARRRSWQLQSRSQSLFKILLLCSPWISNCASMLVLRDCITEFFGPHLNVAPKMYLPHSLTLVPALLGHWGSGSQQSLAPHWNTTFPPTALALRGQGRLPQGPRLQPAQMEGRVPTSVLVVSRGATGSVREQLS